MRRTLFMCTAIILVFEQNWPIITFFCFSSSSSSSSFVVLFLQKTILPCLLSPKIRWTSAEQSQHSSPLPWQNKRGTLARPFRSARPAPQNAATFLVNLRIASRIAHTLLAFDWISGPRILFLNVVLGAQALRSKCELCFETQLALLHALLRADRLCSLPLLGVCGGIHRSLNAKRVGQRRRPKNWIAISDVVK